MTENNREAFKAVLRERMSVSPRELDIEMQSRGFDEHLKCHADEVSKIEEGG